MEYKKSNRKSVHFMEMLLAAVKRITKSILERRLLQKVGLFFIAAEMCLKY